MTKGIYKAVWNESVEFATIEYMGNATLRKLINYLVSHNMARLEFSVNSDNYLLVFHHEIKSKGD